MLTNPIASVPVDESCESRTPEDEDTMARVLHVVKAKIKFENILKEKWKLEFINGYNKELLFLGSEAAMCACEAHKALARIVTEYGFDLAKSNFAEEENA
ncbi:hypothetical protein NDU88_001209 [Pleurodeles waltl]|uniref:Uncharacterized protein n=1 Tax=Pleurodeles waltl TaxID=8319 RepID=A0AAV7VWW0_PLEWA|nr:hypothetical protein NDU88_001209 [Pleurodeles waltl]